MSGDRFGKLYGGEEFWGKPHRGPDAGVLSGSSGLYSQMPPSTLKVITYISGLVHGMRQPVGISRDEIRYACGLGTNVASKSIKIIVDLNLFRTEVIRGEGGFYVRTYKEIPPEDYDWREADRQTLERKEKRDRYLQEQQGRAQGINKSEPLLRKSTEDSESSVEKPPQASVEKPPPSSVEDVYRLGDRIYKGEEQADQPPSVIKEEFQAFADHFTEVTGRKIRVLNDRRLSAYKARRRDFTDEEMRKALDAAGADDWLNGGNPGGKIYLSIDYLLRPDKMERWVNQSQASSGRQPGSQLLEDGQ